MSKPWKTIDPCDSRAFTCALLELVDEGMVDRQQLIEDLLSWMSEHDVEKFCQKMLRDDDNDCVIRAEDEEEEDDEYCDEDALDDFNYVGSRHHY
jgi:DNA-binding ferritin-like protein (Dps family)